MRKYGRTGPHLSRASSSGDCVEYFYSAILPQAYKNFGGRVRLLKRKLDELIPTLPNAAPSPPPRDEDVPSPGPDEDLDLPAPENNEGDDDSEFAF